MKIVCFQNKIELVGEIPRSEKLNFHILDKENFADKIIDIIDVKDEDVKLNIEDFDLFKKIFKADEYKVDRDNIEIEKENEILNISLETTNLNEDQIKALNKVEEFLENPDYNILDIFGPNQCGKSYLIPYIIDLAYKKNINVVELFAPSKRTINKITINNSNININSIYSYIYDKDNFRNQVDEQIDSNDNEQEEENYDNDKIIYPLRENDLDTNFLFIVDESHLISNSYLEFEDCIFGSGYLLKDFLTFAGLLNNNENNNNSIIKKIIFIGDNYLLNLGAIGEYPLNPKYMQEEFKLKVDYFKMNARNLESDILSKANEIASNIDNKIFNNMIFKQNNQISILNIRGNDIKTFLKEFLIRETKNKILVYSNNQAKQINNYIKKEIKNYGDSIKEGDLIVFENSVFAKIESDPFTNYDIINNGEFAKIIEVSNNPFNINFTLRNGKILSASLLEIKFKLITNNDKIYSTLIETNYLQSENNILLEDLKILVNILINNELNKIVSNEYEQSLQYKELIESNEYKRLKEELEILKRELDNGERVKTQKKNKEREIKRLEKNSKLIFKNIIRKNLEKDTNSYYFKYRNIAFVKYGWAITVHKSIYSYFDEVIFDMSTLDNLRENNEQYFRWVYSAITRAKNKIYLINYRPFTPFTYVEFRDSQNLVPINSFILKVQNQENILDEFKNFLNKKILQNNFELINIQNLQYQIRLTLKDISENKNVTINFYYNNRGEFRLPVYQNGDNNTFQKITKLLKNKKRITDFGFISTKWRSLLYQAISEGLKNENIFITEIIQSDYRDRIFLSDENNELAVEMIYNSSGIFTTIEARYYSNIIIWDRFKNFIEGIRENGY